MKTEESDTTLLARTEGEGVPIALPIREESFSMHEVANGQEGLYYITTFMNCL
jgi:hypothetical protein